MPLHFRRISGTQIKSVWAMVAATAAVVLMLTANPATAQDQEALTWQRGVTLAASDDAALRLVTNSDERHYAVEGMDLTLRFQFLRLSGEREWPVANTGRTGTSHLFEGRAGSLRIVAAETDLAVAEYTIPEGRTAIAYLEIATSANATTPTLHRDTTGFLVETRSGTLHVNSSGAPAYRNPSPDGFQLVVPMEGPLTVRLAVSLTPREPAQIEALQLTSGRDLWHRALAHTSHRSQGVALAPRSPEPVPPRR